MSNIGHNRKSRNINTLTSAEKDRLKGVIKELNDSMTRVTAEKDLQKEIVTDAAEKLGIDKKLIRRLGKTFYKATYDLEIEEHKEFEDFYAILLGASS